MKENAAALGKETIIMADAAATTRQKALALNLDATTYGTFAEIGGGQEVARWFFSVGGAAGTVAKTISAYDMAVSDAHYGPTPALRQPAAAGGHARAGVRPVTGSAGGPARGDAKRFFAFADTVATRGYRNPGNGRGWLGVRFQARPHEEPSEIIVHAHLLDSTAAGQQEALGVLGVNLIHAAFFRREDPADLIASLMDDLSRERVEIDMIKLSGPAFPGVDNRLMSLQLVEQGLTDAAMFTASGEVVQPSEVLYKRPILVERGSFRPATKLTLDLLDRALEQFLEEPSVRGQRPVVLAEMTLRSLNPQPDVGHADFLARADILGALGFDVLISRFEPYLRVGRVPGRLHRRADRDRGRTARPPTGRRREVLHRPAGRRARVGRAAVQAVREDVRVPHPGPGHRPDSNGGAGPGVAPLAPPPRLAARSRPRRADPRLRRVLPVDSHARRPGPDPEGRPVLGGDGAGRRRGDDQGQEPLRLAARTRNAVAYVVPSGRR